MREGDIAEVETSGNEEAVRGYTVIAGRKIPDDRELYRSIIQHARDPIARLRARIGLLTDTIRVRIFRFLLTSPHLSWLANVFLGYVGVVTLIRTAIMQLRVFVVRPVQLVLLIDVVAAIFLSFFMPDAFKGNAIEGLANFVNDWFIKPQLDILLGSDNLIEKIPFYLKIVVDFLFDAFAYLPLKLGLMSEETLEVAKQVSKHIADVGFVIPKISYIIRLELVVLAFLLRFPLFARKTSWEDSVPRLLK